MLVDLLSSYLEDMTEIVFAHEGTVAKMIGDAIHVLFGAPAEQPDATAYFKASEKLEARDVGALAAFAALIGEHPNDALTQYHLKRLLNGQSGARIETD